MLEPLDADHKPHSIRSQEVTVGRTLIALAILGITVSSIGLVSANGMFSPVTIDIQEDVYGDTYAFITAIVSVTLASSLLFFLSLSFGIFASSLVTKTNAIRGRYEEGIKNKTFCLFIGFAIGALTVSAVVAILSMPVIVIP